MGPCESTKSKLNGWTRSYSILLHAVILFICQLGHFALTHPVYEMDKLQHRDSAIEDMNDKIKGVHYFSRWREGSPNLSELSRSHIEQVVLVPYGYQDYYDTPNIRFRRRRPGSQDRDSVYVQLAAEATRCGLEVILKPHIWMRNKDDKWRSHIDLANDTEWEQWGRDYRAFIMHYAKLSERIGATYFCLGTELSSVTLKYPHYWRELISAVREVYSGKVFYAANWYREFDQIEFWDALDLVGIQAYFPLGSKENPTVEEIIKEWKPHLQQIKKMSERSGKEIVFSELGYKSTVDAAINPWEWVENPDVKQAEISMQTQANCYEAFFRTFWHRPWFRGVMIWQWRGGTLDQRWTDVDFTPQNKPAEKILENWFGGNKKASFPTRK